MFLACGLREQDAVGVVRALAQRGLASLDRQRIVFPDGGAEPAVPAAVPCLVFYLSYLSHGFSVGCLSNPGQVRQDAVSGNGHGRCTPPLWRIRFSPTVSGCSEIIYVLSVQHEDDIVLFEIVRQGRQHSELLLGLVKELARVFLRPVQAPAPEPLVIVA